MQEEKLRLQRVQGKVVALDFFTANTFIGKALLQWRP